MANVNTLNEINNEAPLVSGNKLGDLPFNRYPSSRTELENQRLKHDLDIAISSGIQLGTRNSLFISADLFTPLKKCASSIISASSDRRKMQRSSLEPPRRAASNGGIFILLQPLDAKIFNETSTIQHLTFSLLRHLPFR